MIEDFIYILQILKCKLSSDDLLNKSVGKAVLSSIPSLPPSLSLHFFLEIRTGNLLGVLSAYRYRKVTEEMLA